MNFFRIVSSIHLISISGLRAFYPNKTGQYAIIKGIAASGAQGKQGAISRGCNTCALTQARLVRDTLYVRQARTYVPRENVCVYMDAANRYTALQHVYMTRLHVLPRDSLLPAAQQWAIASSVAHRRCRSSESEPTNDVIVAPTMLSN